MTASPTTSTTERPADTVPVTLTCGHEAQARPGEYATCPDGCEQLVPEHARTSIKPRTRS